jgi:hypothetical protein
LQSLLAIRIAHLTIASRLIAMLALKLTQVHVACTFENDGTPNATDVKLYVDGTLETISTSTAFALNATASGNAKIGGDIQGRF